MPSLRRFLRFFVALVAAMFVFATFARRAWAYPGVVAGDYGHDMVSGCSKPSGCHNGTGPDPATTTLTWTGGGGGGFVGSTLYVNPGSIVNFTVNISTAGGSVENEKGVNVWASPDVAMSTGDSPAIATTDGTSYNNEITFSPCTKPCTAARTGDSVTYSFSVTAPSGPCTSFTLVAWGNAVQHSNPTGVNRSAISTMSLRSKCGLGTGCSTTTTCASGLCVDGNCCDRSCTATCDTCAGGTCHPTTSPRPPGCGGTGVCSGFCSGSLDVCSFPTTKCAGGLCSSGTETSPAYCSGGSCPSPTTKTCAPYACNAAGTACNGGCAVDGDCAAGNFCSGGACVPKLPPGTACGGDNQCTSAHCVDGVCCDTACTEQCAACNVTGKAGTCSAVVGAPVGGRPPCVTDGTTCGGACDGSTKTACAYPTTQCRAPSCTGGVATLASNCDGAGHCPFAKTVVCAPFDCKGTGCGSACTVDTDCASGFWCSLGTCTPKSVVGTSCGDARECASGNCVDFVCCDKACTNACEACDVKGHVGTCTTVSGPPHGSRTCPAGPDGCPGTCDGTKATCATASCDAGSEAGEAGDAGSETDEAGETSDEAGDSGGPPPFDASPIDALADVNDLAQPNENGGCACRTAQTTGASSSAIASMLVGALAVVARRRRRR